MSEQKTLNNNDLNLDDYCAISIDTSIFRGLGYNFEHPLIKQMSELGEICSILIHDIVYREMESHLTCEINQIDDKVLSVLNEVKRKKTNITEEQLNNIKEVLHIGSKKSIVRDKLSKFSQETKCVVLDNYENFDMRRLISDYFNNTFPFENNNNKKNEFPDAIILHSLEDYAKNNKKQKILVVSKDLGWQKFAEKSQYLEYVDDLSIVYDAIYPFEIKQNIIKCIKQIFYIQPNKQYDTLFDLLVQKINGLDISVEAYCNGAEVGRVDEDYEIDLQNVILSKDLKIKAISIEQGKVSFILPVMLNIYVSTVLGFYHYIDYSQDYREIKRQAYDYEDLFDVDITLEILFDASRNIESLNIGDLTVSKVDLPFDTLDIDYGTVYFDIYEDD